MTDLHCHLLPGIDDGAKDVDMSIELLRMEQKQGVNNIVFTSHFYPEEQDIHDYLKSRNRAFGTLMKVVERKPDLDFSYKLGAEVYYSPKLRDIETELLCFTRTPYLLLEFSYTREPSFLDEVLYDLQTRGIRPILAHVERYKWLENHPDRLHKWVEEGIILQSNSGPLLSGGNTGKYIQKLLKWNLVQVLSSDAHHPEKRPPRLGEGIMFVSETLGKEKAATLLKNGNQIFWGKEPVPEDPVLPRKVLGRWV